MTADIHQIYDRQQAEMKRIKASIDGGGGDGYDGGMEARVAKLETDLSAIKSDVALIAANGATKSDIAELRGAVKTDIAELKGTFAELKGSTKADLADAKGGLKADIAEAKTSIIMWVVIAIFLAQLLPIAKDLVKDYRTHESAAIQSK